MNKFFSNGPTSVDPDVIQNHKDYARSLSNAVDCDNGGVSPEQRLYQYREREPYHYIEEGSDGYYYWTYGETVVIEVDIQDWIAFTDAIPDFVVDVRIDGSSIVDRATGVASLELGSMAKESSSDYYTAAQVLELFNSLTTRIQSLDNLATELEKGAEGMTEAVYNIIAERPGVDGYYLVTPNFPFMLMLDDNQTELKVRTSDAYNDEGDTFYSIRCTDSADLTRYADVSIAQLPKNMPFIGVYDTKSTPHLFKSGMTLLPDYYLNSRPDQPQDFIPQVAKNTAIASYGMPFTSHQLDITEETVAAALNGEFSGIRGETDGD